LSVANLLFLHLPLSGFIVLGFILLWGFAVVLIFLTFIYVVAAFIYSLFRSYLFNFTMFTLLLVTQYLAPMRLNQVIYPLYVLGLLALFLGLGGFEAWWEHHAGERDRRLFEEWQAQERERRKRQQEAKRERKKQQGEEPYRRHDTAWCYWVLGIPETAALQEVKQAYRRMVLRYHPDVNKSRDAEARMKEINEAYERLTEALYKTEKRNN
jgi:hypothetical protein